MSNENHPVQDAWLLKKDPAILRFFITILMFGLVGGVLRFLFPFQILNMGGPEALISWGSAFSSSGQILAFLVLTRIIHGRKNTLLAAGGLLGIFAIVTGSTSDSGILAASRISEGAGSGLFIILIIRISSELKSSRGEGVGTLLAALFLGSAIGQGFAGASVNALAVIAALDQMHTIKVIGVTLFFLSLLLLGLTAGLHIAPGTGTPHASGGHGHMHSSFVLKALSSRPVLILALIYIIYDFSHGIYTPGLSILIESHGVPIDQIAFGYLIGDLVWGATQVYAGRLVDRHGHYAPLVLSLILKGLVVTAYPNASSFMLLAPALALAGMSEGFIEPSRNDAAIELTPAIDLVHEHEHHYLSRATGSSFGIASHKHAHTHAVGSDEIVSFLQTLGMVGFAVGSIGGAWLLGQGLTLSNLAFLGAGILICAGILSLGLRKRAIVS